MNQDTFSQSNAVVFFGFIGHDLDHHGAFSAHALRNLNNRVSFRALADALTTRHGNRIVVQNFVRDVHASGNALTDCQDTAVKISAIPDVGKHMFLMAEVLLANPRRALAPHLRKTNRAAVHPHTHEMATNARHRTRSFGYFGAGIVGTT